MPEREHIDIMQAGYQRPARWNAANPDGLVNGLAGLLEAAGLPGQLAASRRLLERAEELGQAARDAKAAAEERMRAEHARLMAGDVDTGRLASALAAAAPWLDTDVEAGRAAVGMAALMNAAAQCRGQAVAVAAAESPALHRELQGVVREAVGRIAAVPALPRQVWSAPTGGAASTAAIERGHDLEWSVLVREGARFDRAHTAAAMLRDAGALGAQTMYPAGCPEAVGCQFLQWEAALEQLGEVRRLPGPLRIRACVDRGLEPGLYLASDHTARPEPKRGPLAAVAALVGR